MRLRPPDVSTSVSTTPEPPTAVTSNAIAPSAIPPSAHDDFTRHRDDVARYLTWLRVPQHAIDELTQDVFLVAHRRRQEFRGESSIKTWLSGIAFHLVLNWRRRRKWHEYWEQPDTAKRAPMAPESATTARTAMDDLLTKELCSSVAKVLEEQPEAARSLWLMVVLEEIAVSRAAKLLGFSEYQAQQSFTKTQQRVQQAFAREGRTRIESVPLGGSKK